MSISATSAALDILRKRDASMADVLSALSSLDKSETAFPTARIGIAANVTVDLLANYLRRYAYLAGVRLEVRKGSYDNLLGDIEGFCREGIEYLIVIPFFDNLLPAWEVQVGHLDTDTRQAPILDYLSRLKLVLDRASAVGNIIVAGAHLWHSPASFDGESPEVDAIAEFNAALRIEASKRNNVRILDTGAIMAMLGARHAFDRRFYYRGKSPYTPQFLDEFSRRYCLMTRGFGAAFYKVLVLDCDNTLWGGIVGEDGVAGIKLDPYSYPGNVFWNIQHQILALEQNGILVCLCSKNNPADVDDVLGNHVHAVLKNEHIVLKKVNWNDKVTNLKELAAELNLGLDSFILIDDSSFEVEAVRSQLPMVRVFQVPENLPDYPSVLREVSEHFLAGGLTAENRSKTQQYRQLAVAVAEQGDFASYEDYLRSLNLRVEIHRDAMEMVSRISELTMKSNQFNLTTRRYTPSEISGLMESASSTVYSFSVADRFGDCGITGVTIVEYEGDVAFVKAFLMSCRVIGRGVEFSIWKTVFADACARGMTRLVAEYLPSEKNAQVADFFDRLGLELVYEGGDGSRRYEADVAKVCLADSQSQWVELIDGR